MRKRLFVLALTVGSLGLFAPAAGASCTPNPTDIGPGCLETLACDAVNHVTQADCIE